MKCNSNCKHLTNPNTNCPVCFAAFTQNFEAERETRPICLPLNTIITCSNSANTNAGNSEVFITQPGIYQVCYFIVGKRCMDHHSMPYSSDSFDMADTANSGIVEATNTGYHSKDATFTFSIFQNDKKLVKTTSDRIRHNGCDTISDCKTFTVSCCDHPSILSFAIKTESTFTFDYFISIQKVRTTNCRNSCCSSDSRNRCNCC